MLPGVLVNMIEPAPPGDPALYFRSLQGGSENVRDAIAVVVVDNLRDRDSVNGPEIVRLSARCWIKSGAVQVNAPAVGASVRDAGAKIGQIAIGVVEAFRHANILLD